MVGSAFSDGFLIETGPTALQKTEWLIILFSRVIMNLSFRVVYPFLPAISRGLGIPLQEAGLLLTVRSSTGLAGLLFGVWGERAGYVRWMVTALTLLAGGACLVAFSWSFLWALAGFACLGLAQTAYVPASQAYVSRSVPYARRARVIGFIESTWSTSWFIGIPLSGLLIARCGWHSPFVLLGAGGLLSIYLTTRLKPVAEANTAERTSPADSAKAILAAPAATAPLLPLVATLLMSFANENMMIVLGAWLEKSFAMKVTALGFFTALAGVAELAGEMTVALAVDRLRKSRTVLLGLVLSGLAYVALPACQSSLMLALTGLMAMFFLFEVTFVSMVSYVSELSPTQRGKWLATNYSLNVAGRLIASLTGPWLWAMGQGIF